MKRILAFIFILMIGQLVAQTEPEEKLNIGEKMKQTEQTEHYTFQLSDKVTRQSNVTESP